MRALVTVLSLVFIFSTPSFSAKAMSCLAEAKGGMPAILAEARRLDNIIDALPGRLKAYISEVLGSEPGFLLNLEAKVSQGQYAEDQPMSTEDILIGLRILLENDVRAFKRAARARLRSLPSKEAAALLAQLSREQRFYLNQ